MIDKHIHENEFRLRILMTNDCNKDCSFCLNDFQPKGNTYINPMEAVDCLRAYSTFMKSVNERSIVTFSGGEPGLHPWLDFALKYARYYCDIVKVVTNGEALCPHWANYVDQWHVGVTGREPQVIDFAQYSNNITVQIVVTSETSYTSLLKLATYYLSAGIRVKLFVDFNMKDESEFRAAEAVVEQIIAHCGDGVSTRFTGKQINRGVACAGCEKKCITLKALWVFPDGSSTTCPQGLRGRFDFDSWDETVEVAHGLHNSKL